MNRAQSSATRLRAAIVQDRDRIARGERPSYHATWSTSVDGAADVRIVELPLIHLFVPDARGVRAGARLLIARTLDVEPAAFDLEVIEPGRGSPAQAPPERRRRAAD
jgi:hypothetical protein